MEVGVTSVRSILDKPLNQLTEEDISQLTREDCRKYLKEKGMRRPSWNKSQAIQQVISLKALLEPADDSGAGALRKVLVPPPQNAPPVSSNSADSSKEPSTGAQVLVSGEDNGPSRLNDSSISPPSRVFGCTGDADKKIISPRSPGEANALFEQMTIFYCGKVNVYDGVPPDKARAIMHLAASPIGTPQDDPFCGNAALRPFQCHLRMLSDKHGVHPSGATLPQAIQTEKMLELPQHYREKGNFPRDPDVEGQASREVSLKRYREKRKDRGRFLKGRKNTGPTSSSLEIYLNHQVRTQTANGQSSRSSTSSPPGPRLPHILCSSAHNQAKTAGLSVDLNNEDV